MLKASLLGVSGGTRKTPQVPRAEARQGWDPEVVTARASGSGALVGGPSPPLPSPQALLVLLRLLLGS